MWTEELVRDRALRMAALPVPRAVVKPTRSKYRVKRDPVDRTYNGIVYDSEREMRHAQELDFFKLAGRISNIARQVPFVLQVNGIKICKIVIDFEVTWHTGQVVYQEVKGFETKDWKLKRKLFTALYPTLEYEVIK